MVDPAKTRPAKGSKVRSRWRQHVARLVKGSSDSARMRAFLCETVQGCLEPVEPMDDPVDGWTIDDEPDLKPYSMDLWMAGWLKNRLPPRSRTSPARWKQSSRRGSSRGSVEDYCGSSEVCHMTMDRGRSRPPCFFLFRGFRLCGREEALVVDSGKIWPVRTPEEVQLRKKRFVGGPGDSQWDSKSQWQPEIGEEDGRISQK